MIFAKASIEGSTRKFVWSDLFFQEHTGVWPKGAGVFHPVYAERDRLKEDETVMAEAEAQALAVEDAVGDERWRRLLAPLRTPRGCKRWYNIILAVAV